MSTLKQTVIERRQSEPEVGNPCYSASAGASTLLVEASNGENWLLPWHHFIQGCHQSGDGGEQLTLTFSLQEVRVWGKHLAAIRDEIVHLRLEGLRPAPQKYLSSPAIEMVVSRITVRPRAEANSGG